MRLLIIVLLFPFLSYSQDSSSTYLYAEIVGTGKILSNKLNVIIDHGQGNNPWFNNKMVDDKGKPITFNSMVDAMNYMSNIGWEFLQAYVVTEPGGLGGSQNVYRWLLRISANPDNAGDLVPITKREFKSQGKN